MPPEAAVVLVRRGRHDARDAAVSIVERWTLDAYESLVRVLFGTYPDHELGYVTGSRSWLVARPLAEVETTLIPALRTAGFEVRTEENDR